MSLRPNLPIQLAMKRHSKTLLTLGNENKSNQIEKVVRPKVSHPSPSMESVKSISTTSTKQGLFGFLTDIGPVFHYGQPETTNILFVSSRNQTIIAGRDNQHSLAASEDNNGKLDAGCASAPCKDDDTDMTFEDVLNARLNKSTREKITSYSSPNEYEEYFPLNGSSLYPNGEDTFGVVSELVTGGRNGLYTIKEETKSRKKENNTSVNITRNGVDEIAYDSRNCGPTPPSNLVGSYDTLNGYANGTEHHIQTQPSKIPDQDYYINDFSEDSCCYAFPGGMFLQNESANYPGSDLNGYLTYGSKAQSPHYADHVPSFDNNVTTTASRERSEIEHELQIDAHNKSDEPQITLLNENFEMSSNSPTTDESSDVNGESVIVDVTIAAAALTYPRTVVIHSLSTHGSVQDKTSERLVHNKEEFEGLIAGLIAQINANERRYATEIRPHLNALGVGLSTEHPEFPDGRRGLNDPPLLDEEETDIFNQLIYSGNRTDESFHRVNGSYVYKESHNSFSDLSGRGIPAMSQSQQGVSKAPCCGTDELGQFSTFGLQSKMLSIMSDNMKVMLKMVRGLRQSEREIISEIDELLKREETETNRKDSTK